ncbi:hypothetical protein OCF65_29475 [Bacillus toyonensis]|uniref:Uncharacterized protein n=2 Tax=Bacillus toyonensis TaxID=155322 RepID=A0A2B4VG87_9BACI|nr:MULTISPECIES: hypothetical protein [Bacillus]EEL31003.1 hypothetical protein bcere0019_58980 [Bacillus cereus Rock3-28]OTX25549.1 hypothetical protein BK717_32490 [Bacillus thuringiensis serovar malayensis]OUB02626.1 hypothetical protein BK709_25855 [Bacillus thuringiensis serovar shandongiensis]ARC27508.1 hypothetical protein A6J74_00315 [Bacillus sp. FDAARGOS_235]EJQ79009.1 hypothetical protein IGO_05430 [Bacillus toyonensis]
MADKKRESFFWNLKKIENEEFFKWFESQGNIADSLYKLVCYFIDKHGLQDVGDYKIQQQMQREILLQDKDFLNEVKRVLLNDSKLIIKNDDQNIHNEIKSSNEVIGTSEEKPDNEDEKKEDVSKSETNVLNDEYDDLDTASLFGN